MHRKIRLCHRLMFQTLNLVSVCENQTLLKLLHLLYNFFDSRRFLPQHRVPSLITCTKAAILNILHFPSVYLKFLSKLLIIFFHITCIRQVYCLASTWLYFSDNVSFLFVYKHTCTVS